LIEEIKIISDKIPKNNGVIVAFSTYWLLDKILGILIKNNDDNL
jgi:hypothetical protein